MTDQVTTAPQTSMPAIAEKPLQYLDKAVNAIRDLGIWPEQQGEQPITGLLSQITELDETRVILIGLALIVMITDFEVGQLLFSAVLPSGTSTFASGKYVAAQRREIGYGTMIKLSARRSPSVK